MGKSIWNDPTSKEKTTRHNTNATHSSAHVSEPHGKAMPLQVRSQEDASLTALGKTFPSKTSVPDLFILLFRTSAQWQLDLCTLKLLMHFCECNLLLLQLTYFQSGSTLKKSF